VHAATEAWPSHRAADGSITLDIVEHTGTLYMNIILACLVGTSHHKSKVLQRVNGVEKHIHLGKAVSINFEKAMARMLYLHFYLFPEFLPFYWLTPSDRELLYNCN